MRESGIGGEMLAGARRAGRESDGFLGCALPGAALVGNELSPGYNMAVLQTARSGGEWGGRI
ncbi:MAG: hypothetical protein JWR69_1140 [Pedosphaera sp.]|nr:hypothetical protein [Pedosphaera sp.]